MQRDGKTKDIQIPTEIHTKLKVYAAKVGKPIREVTIAALEAYLK